MGRAAEIWNSITTGLSNMFTGYSDTDKVYKKKINSITPTQRWNAAYFKGLSALDPYWRKQWEDKYKDKTQGMDAATKDEFFRNTLFAEAYGKSDDPNDRALYEKMKNDPEFEFGKRDSLFAAKALEKDLDGFSDIEDEGSIAGDIFEGFFGSAEKGANARIKMYHKDDENGNASLRDEARKKLDDNTKSEILKVERQAEMLTPEQKAEVISNFRKFSENSPYYKEYKNTSKIDDSDEAMLRRAIEYQAALETGGEFYANNKAIEDYQREVADKQIWLEKVGDAGVQFVDSVIETGAMTLNLIGGTLAGTINTLLRGDFQNIFDNILDASLDNDFAKWAADLMATGAWDPEEQKKYKELGFSKYQIVNTPEQERQIFTSNTIYELIGQYGFTAASTMASIGLSSALKAETMLTKGLVGAGAKAGRYSMRTAAQLASKLKWIENIGQSVLVPGMVGTSEGALNAINTYDDTKKGLMKTYDEQFAKNTIQRAEDLGISQEDAALLVKDIQKYSDDKEMLDVIKSSIPGGEKAVNDYIEGLSKVEEAAKAARNTDFYINSFINGMLNTTLGRTLQAPRVQAATEKTWGQLKKWGRKKLGMNPKSSFDDFVNIENLGKEGFKAAAKDVTKRQAIASIAKTGLKEMHKEGLEEYKQDLSSAGGKTMANKMLASYLHDKYGFSDGSDAYDTDFWSLMGAFLSGASDVAFDTGTLKSYTYGALSTGMGGVNINQNIQGGKWREDWTSPIVWRSAFNDIVKLNSVQNKMQINNDAVAKKLNEFFSDKDSQELFFNGRIAAQTLADIEELGQRGDGKGVRDKTLQARFSAIQMLKQLEGTEYYDTVMEFLKARANFNIENLTDKNSIESKAVAEYLKKSNEGDKGMSMEEAFNEVKGQAENMLNLIDQVEKIGNKVDRKFSEELDNDVKSAFILNELKRDNSKERMDKIDGEFEKINEELTTKEVSENSPLSEKGRNLIATKGSYEEAAKEVEKNKKEVEDSKKELERLKEGKKKAKKKKQTENAKMYDKKIAKEEQFLKEKEAEYKKNKKLLKEYEKSADTETIEDSTTGKTTEKTSEHVLSEREIMALPAKERAEMLNPKNKDRYSEAQQKVIENLKVIASNVDNEFESKIKDRARLENSYNESLEDEFKLLTDPSYYVQTAKEYKEGARREFIRRKHESNIQKFIDEEDSKGLRTYMNKLAKENGMEYALIAASFKDNDLMKNYLKKDSESSDIMQVGVDRGIINIRDKSDEARDKEDSLWAALDFLADKGIEATSDEAVEALLEKNPDTDRTFFEEFYDEWKESESMNEDAEFANIIPEFKELIAAYKEELEKKDSKEETTEDKVDPEAKPAERPATDPIPVDNTEGEEVGPSPLKGDKGKNTKKDDKEDSKTEDDENLDDVDTSGVDEIVQKFVDSNNNDNVSIMAESVVNTIKNSDDFNEEVRQEALEEIDAISDQEFDEDSFVNKLASIINGRRASSEEEIDDVANLLERSLGSAESNLNDLRKGKDSEETKTSKKIFNKLRKAITDIYQRVHQRLASQYSMFTNPNPDSDFIASMNLAYMGAINSTKKENSDLYQFFVEHKSSEFLLKNPQLAARNTRNKILFMTKKSLTDKVSKIEGYSSEKDIPLIAVLEVDKKTSTTIEIDGKHYQPLAPMPATGRKDADGSNYLGNIRKRAAANTMDAELVKGEDGKPMRFTLKASPIVKHPDQNFNGDNNVMQLAIAELSDKDRSEIKKAKLADRKELKAYTDSRKAFIDQLIEVDLPGREGYKQLAYVQHQKGTNPIFIFIKEVDEMTQPDTGETIQEWMEKGKDISKFNSRTRRAVNQAISVLEKSKPESFDIEIEEDAEGNKKVIPLGDTEATLREIEKSLTEGISNGLYINKNDGYGIKAELVPTENGVALKLSLVNSNIEDLNISLGTASIGNTKETLAGEVNGMIEQLLKAHLNGLVTLKPQAIYKEVEAAKAKNSKALDTLNELYDDGLFKIAASELNPQVGGVVIKNPYKKETKPSTETANSDNASAPKNSSNEGTGTINTPKGPVNVDTGRPTGPVAEGARKNESGQGENKGVEWANNKAKEIQENTRNKFDQSKTTSSTYTDTMKVRYLRVTTAKSLESRAKGRYGKIEYGNKPAYKDEKVFDLDENKLWQSDRVVLPSDVTIPGFDENVGDMTIKAAFNKLKKSAKTGDTYKEILLPLWQAWANHEDNQDIVMNLYGDVSGKRIISSNANGETDAARALSDVLSSKENPYTLPSTLIGNSVDNFVRDFFANKEFDFTKPEEIEKNYPNIAAEHLQTLYERLKTIKLPRGSKVYSADIMAFGKLRLKREGQEPKEIDVAGTLDLLVVDGDGNFHIYDMKTHRKDTIDKEKEDGYATQLSLYASLLEAEYGIKISTINIIPIKVNYDTPKYMIAGGKRGTAVYSEDSDNKGQLLIDGEKFLGANPTLGVPKRLTRFKDMEFEYSKMTNEERELFESVEETEGSLEESGATIEVPKAEGPTMNAGLNSNFDSKAAFGNMENTGEITDDDLDYLQSRHVGERVQNPMRANTEYSAGEILDIHTDMNSHLPEEHHALAKAVFDICEQFGIKFKRNESLEDNGVYHSDTGTVEFGNKISLNTLLHEAIHAATSYYMNYADKESLPRNIQSAIRDMEVCYDTYKELATKQMGTENIPYGFTSLNEFVAELSNPVFRASLQRMDAQNKKGLFSRIIDSVARFLGINKGTKVSEKTAYSALQTLLDNSNAELFTTSKARAANIRKFMNMLTNEKHNFPSVEIDSSTFSDMEGNFMTGHAKTVTLRNENLRKGSVLTANIKDAEGNIKQAMVTVTNKPVKNNDGTVTANMKILDSADMEGNVYQVNKDKAGNVYLTRNEKSAGLGIDRYIPSSLKFGVWEGVTNEEGQKINIDKSMDNISKFYTEQEWNSLTNEEMEHELECKGVFG